MDKLFSQKDELAFKQAYAIQFMAAYTASKYDEYNGGSKHYELNHPPVEDAYWLADYAWDEWKKILGLNNRATSSPDTIARSTSGQELDANVATEVWDTLPNALHDKYNPL